VIRAPELVNPAVEVPEVTLGILDGCVLPLAPIPVSLRMLALVLVLVPIPVVVDPRAEDVTLPAAPVRMADGVTVTVAAFSQGEITHREAKALSTYLPFCLVGVRLRV
jgi:hypothetical protein